jgi:hypothetical protein
MHEDGIGMARSFELEFSGLSDDVHAPRAGFFAWVYGAPAEGYRAPRTAGPQGSVGPAASGCGSAPPLAGLAGQPVTLRGTGRAPVAVITGEYGAQVLGPLVAAHPGAGDVRLVVVPNLFFGGNIAVTGLLVGEDVGRALAEQPAGHRYLLPDVCLSGGRFLDGSSVDDLPRPVEVVATSGAALRAALDGNPGRLVAR